MQWREYLKRKSRLNKDEIECAMKEAELRVEEGNKVKECAHTKNGID